jgi:hypothetical protein
MMSVESQPHHHLTPCNPPPALSRSLPPYTIGGTEGDHSQTSNSRSNNLIPLKIFQLRYDGSVPDTIP